MLGTGPLARLMAVALAAAALAVVGGCGDDDGAGVRNVGETETQASGTGSGTGSGSGTGTGSGAAGASRPFGGYEPVSDVSQHARVTLDVAAINASLDAEPVDFRSAARTYANGGNSAGPDGPRTLKGFAAERRDEPIWNDYVRFYGDPAWLDTFVTQALQGRGPFAGEPDAVRRQGVQKGVQNGIMIAWMLHELVAAQADVAAGEIDPASGAPHKVDEAWAFYHGENPDGAPYATAAKRGADFGTGDAVNEAMLAQAEAARDAAVAGDAEALDAAVAEMRRQILITYLQAAIKYSATTDAALADGDREAARVQQAEGLAFFRVIAPLVAEADEAAARAALREFDLSRPPRRGIGDRVSTALTGTLGALGIEPDEVGTFSG